MKTRDKYVIVFSALSLIFAACLSITGKPGYQGIQSVLLMGIIILLLATEALPVGLTGLLTIALPPLLGLCDGLAASASHFFSPIFFFLLSAFGIAAAMGNVPLTRRMLRFFLMHFGRSAQSVIFAILISLAITSSVIANFPALILFLGISTNFLTIYKKEADRKKTGRVLMIGLPLASSIGGMTTPVGSAQMMMGMEFLQKSGTELTFLQWMGMGLPAALLLLPATYFVLLKLFPPAPLAQKEIQAFCASIEVPEKLQKNERFMLLILALLIIGWITSPLLDINIMYVSFIGLIFMLIPQFHILDWPTFNTHVNWSTIFMVCGVMGLCDLLMEHGITAWIIELLLQIVPADISESGLITILGIVIFMILLFIPNGIAVVSLMTLPMIEAAQHLGLQPVPIVAALVTFATFAIIIPLEPVYFLTYSTGYYKMRDMVKQGIVNSLLIILLVAVLYPLCARLLVL